MRVACEKGLNMDFGVKFAGNRSAVKYTVSLGELVVDVDWNESKTVSSAADAADADAADADASGGTAASDSAMFSLVRGVSEAVGVWYNLTGKMKCFDREEMSRQLRHSNKAETGLTTDADTSSTAAGGGDADGAGVGATSSDPPAAAPDLEVEAPKVCGASFAHHSKTESWSGVTCNENLHLVRRQPALVVLRRVTTRTYLMPPPTSQSHSLRLTSSSTVHAGQYERQRDRPGLLLATERATRLEF
jgi:hypothetical protein